MLLCTRPSNGYGLRAYGGPCDAEPYHLYLAHLTTSYANAHTRGPPDAAGQAACREAIPWCSRQAPGKLEGEPMSTPSESILALKRRLKIAALSLLGLLLPAACARPQMTCYTPSPPTRTPFPAVLCYEPIIEISVTPSPTTFTSPISPLPTPTPTLEARRMLRDKLLAGNRFPDQVVKELGS
jgi:hypothetical protein